MKKILVLFSLIIIASSSGFASGEVQSENGNSEAKTIYLTKADFLTKVFNFEENPAEWKYLGDKPCLIDFYATWCGPCKRIAPILDELAGEYDGQIYIYKIDAEKEKELAAVFAVRGYPALLFIPMENRPQMAMGALSKEEFKEAINNVLLEKKSEVTE